MKEQIEYAGIGSIENLAKIISGKERVFLVCGKHSFELSGAQKQITKILANEGVEHHRFSGYRPNPSIEDIKGGLKAFSSGDYDLILGVGGGSALDVAKSIKSSFRDVPLVLVPTTAGTGSEATYFISYYLGNEKRSMGDPETSMADYVILDPDFCMSMPNKLAASSGLDALGQAIESYWSINSTDESKRIAGEAISSLAENLERSVVECDESSREKVLYAANKSGKAINITKTGAGHSISYPMTGYFGVSHGQAVAISLPSLLRFNYGLTEDSLADGRGVGYVKATIGEICDLLGVGSVEKAGQYLTNLISILGLEVRLSKLGMLSEGDIDIIVRNGFTPGRIDNNPRWISPFELKEILEGIR